MSLIYRTLIAFMIAVLIVLLAPKIAISRDAAVRGSGICSRNILTIRPMSWEEGCGEMFATWDTRECRAKVDVMNRIILKYNSLIYKCRSAEREHQRDDPREAQQGLQRLQDQDEQTRHEESVPDLELEKQDET